MTLSTSIHHYIPLVAKLFATALRLPRKIGDKTHIVKFSEGPCADTKTDSRRSDRSCSNGVFLELAKQPRLGLLHQVLRQQSLDV